MIISDEPVCNTEKMCIFAKSNPASSAVRHNNKVYNNKQINNKGKRANVNNDILT